MRKIRKYGNCEKYGKIRKIRKYTNFYRNSYRQSIATPETTGAPLADRKKQQADRTKTTGGPRKTTAGPKTILPDQQFWQLF